MLRAYFNERADIWDEAIAEKGTARLERMAKRLKIGRGFTVLDVGTGTGVFLPFLLSEVGKDGRLISLDLAERMLRQARAKGVSGSVDYLQADATNIPLRHGIFDMVVCYSSFPHFRDKPKALTEMHRVIKDGGRLLICHTSGRATINAIHRQNPTVENDILPGENEMRLMLSAAGFAEIKIDDSSDSYLASAAKPR